MHADPQAIPRQCVGRDDNSKPIAPKPLPGPIHSLKFSGCFEQVGLGERTTMIQSLGRQLLAPFCAPSFNNRLAVPSLHADKKSMGAGAFDGAGLKGSFAHNAIPFIGDNLFIGDRGKSGLLCSTAPFPLLRPVRAGVNKAPDRRRNKYDDPRPSIHFSKEVYFNHRGPFLSNYFPSQKATTRTLYKSRHPNHGPISVQRCTAFWDRALSGKGFHPGCKYRLIPYNAFPLTLPRQHHVQALQRTR